MTRALVVAGALVIASAGLAVAQDTGGVPAAKPAAPDPFLATLYFGGGIGVADQDGTDVGWGIYTLTRPFRNGGFQLEYFNAGQDKDDSGNYDGLYLGLMPILPLAGGASVFGQVGGAFGNGDEAVAGGAGALYDLPTEWFDNVFNNGVTLRADYKYYDFDQEAHIFTIGFMFGIHK